jgi:hypothetical protein
MQAVRWKHIRIPGAETASRGSRKTCGKDTARSICARVQAGNSILLQMQTKETKEGGFTEGARSSLSLRGSSVRCKDKVRDDPNDEGVRSSGHFLIL